ncbi:MAG TPA: UDP-3-O-(3-hydroxymyristoyl)glucosamine N-acyltransferase, partial [Accumulibacter sp.]|nr:UDP-3-O-(3-hydroxymyristoyl)glucosamine N-acyltransferase [Accumulibacter sp.]
GGKLLGDGSLIVTQVASLQSARPGQIAFLANAKFRRLLVNTRASALIVAPAFAEESVLPRIVHPNAYACYARVAALLNPPPARRPGIAAGAVVHSVLPASASVGENAVIGQRVTFGENVTIHAACVIGDGVYIGDDSLLYPRVVVYHDCIIGKRAIIHSGAVIGADGFGFAKEDGRWLKIPQIGRVLIGDDVEIGANTSIDRGALDDTLIGDGVKLDNQIQIGHNVHLGEQTALAGCVGIAGSTHIGRRCTVGGAGMIIGHLELADDVHISAGTMVTRSLRQPGQYTSIFPLEAHDDWRHNAAQIKRLARLAERVGELEKQLQNKGNKS